MHTLWDTTSRQRGCLRVLCVPTTPLSQSSGQISSSASQEHLPRHWMTPLLPPRCLLHSHSPPRPIPTPLPTHSPPLSLDKIKTQWNGLKFLCWGYLFSEKRRFSYKELCTFSVGTRHIRTRNGRIEIALFRFCENNKLCGSKLTGTTPRVEILMALFRTQQT